jgi:hypothetical protein
MLWIISQIALTRIISSCPNGKILSSMCIFNNKEALGVKSEGFLLFANKEIFAK